MFEDQDEEDFWKTNKYFVDAQEAEQDDSYVEQNEAKLDSYDSDFGNSSDDEDGEDNGAEEVKLNDDGIKKYLKKEKKEKKQKIKNDDDVSSHASEQKKWYIHDVFN